MILVANDEAAKHINAAYFTRGVLVPDRAAMLDSKRQTAICSNEVDVKMKAWMGDPVVLCIYDRDERRIAVSETQSASDCRPTSATRPPLIAARRPPCDRRFGKLIMVGFSTQISSSIAFNQDEWVKSIAGISSSLGVQKRAKVSPEISDGDLVSLKED